MFLLGQREAKKAEWARKSTDLIGNGKEIRLLA